MLNWPNATIYQGIDAVASENPDTVAMRFEGEATTYNDLIAESKALAHGLADLGIGAKDRIAVWLSNRPEWIKAQLAASYLGATIVAVNTRYRTHELEYMMSDSSCSVLLTEEAFLGNQYLEMVADAIPEIETTTPEEFNPDSVPSLEHVIALDSHDDFPAVRAYADVEDSGREQDDISAATEAEVPACVFYTSGTTSDPKGVLQSNRSLLNHSYQVGEHLGLGEDDVGLGILPFCGIWGYNMFMSVLTHGIPQIVQTHFDAEQTIRNVEDHGVTYMSGLATMYQRLIEDDAFTEDRVASLTKGVIGFVSMGYDESVFEAIEDRTGIPICQPYGLSEGNSQIFVGDPNDSQESRKRVGGPMIFPEEEQVRIADPESGDALPDGESGEICLKGFNVMNEYLGKPDKTNEAIDNDGWFHTGDLGVRDPENGHLYYQSRMDDALRIRGFLVAPRDIETVINEHEGVSLSQVVGAPHPRHGQVAVAFVQRSDETLTADEIYEFLDDYVADYKEPEAIEFVDEFPRSAGPHGEKIQKVELRDRVADRYVE
ncbi:class I adenylate-forming enzyme family protein [Halobacterium sp. KA-6]|jgi:fatty-acyl-CoA synthase|uniref:class I adenylate-forming enzyme family protein n=1 Tax=Halobacterium sp. KA-6 TaxID=2896368 RepID=UPI001E2DDB2D|nr:class I adenylate-forming enzyme family protein [Halobacterium sp. KA-6]MCD2203377.1 acyl--CoA ligase [Halobacterium sp. KA-6]